MNTNRVTLTVFGTTGVLLAASLTMLAIVSALVTFDAWPTRDRGASAAQIAVEHPHAARVVRAVRRASATTGGGTTAGGGGAPGGGPGVPLAAGGPSGGRDGGGGGDPSNPTADLQASDPTPVPRVGSSPPGEGDPGSGGPPTIDAASAPTAVHEVACGAGSTVSGVNGAAGAVVGAGC